MAKDTEPPTVAGDVTEARIKSSKDVILGDDNLQDNRTFNRTTNITAFLQPGDLPSQLLGLLSQESQGLWNRNSSAEETEAYLSQLEDLIRRELRKAGDEQFVELSMKMAQSSSESTAGNLYRLAEGDSDDDERTIRDLAGLQEELGTRPLVLLGIPGSGKSTVLHHLTLLMIGAYRDGKSKKLPFFVRLTEYDLFDGRAEPILQFLKSRATALVGEKHFISRDFEDLTRQNRLVFILDGLDQMPGRRSETIRIKQLKRIENELRHVDWMLKIARRFRLKKFVSRLLGRRQAVTSGAAPKADPREEQIEMLPELFPLQCAVIASCRVHDFIGVPRWETLSILAMDASQIGEFIKLYAPGAEAVITPHSAASLSTRSLVSNPFYLRMLTRELKEGLRDSNHYSQLTKALTRRGRLLEFLIREGVYRYVDQDEKDLNETKDQKQARVNYILGKLGALAYYMLERNVIGSVPHDALERILGDDLRPVIDAGVDGNLIMIHEGEIGSVEFNHQLFLEFLLAFDLKRKTAEEGGFAEALKLLSRRGDRWAETIRLLFEMVDEASAEELIDRFVEALRAPETWDISTRVLSDLGPRVANYVAPLLRETDEMAATGAVTILGKTNAQEFAGDLAGLSRSNSWRVRRAAVEALAAMRLPTKIAVFNGDDHASVVRAVFRARLSLEDSPETTIKTEIFSQNQSRAVQMAFAALEVFGSLLVRLSDDALLDLVRSLVGHRVQDIRVLGFLMIGQSPVYIRRRLKPELRKGALDDDDATVNHYARRALSPFLDQNDLAEIKKLAPKPEEGPLFWDRQNRRALSAYWLLLEARETVSPSEYLDSLFRAPKAEVQLLAKKLGRRADSTSLSFLTFLLADSRTAPAAVEALVGLREKGVAHLLEALSDPSPQIRIQVAELLKFCHLPGKYGRQLRKILREAKISTHEAKWLVVATRPGASLATPNRVAQVALQATTPVLAGFIYWLVSRIMGSQANVSYWLRYQLWLGSVPVPKDIGGVGWVRQVQTLAFGSEQATRDADFWLARGQLERALGRKAESKESLKKSLNLRPDSAATRLELALIQWSLGNIELAKETIEGGDRKDLVKGSGLEALRRLLSIEETRGEYPSGADEIERMQLLDRLGLWPQAQVAALSLLRKQRDLAEATLVLFHAYLGKKQTRRALASAVAYNELVSEGLSIRQVELEDLHWQHRSDPYPATEIGKFEIAVDLENDAEALDVLRSLEILPNSGMEISENHIDDIQQMPSEVQVELRDLLARSGYTEAARLITDSMPAQQPRRVE